MIFYSIITQASEDARELRYTARSLAVQNDAPTFEWMVVGGQAPKFGDDELQIAPAQIVDNINRALALASGEYVWFLPAGACLSDAFVLRDVKRGLISNLMPDLFYAAWREHGILASPKSFSALNGAMIAPLSAMLFRRRMIDVLRFDPSYAYAADYDFVLRFADKAVKISSAAKIIVDLDRPKYTETQRKVLRAEYFAVREKLLRQSKTKNTLIDWEYGFADVLKNHVPKIYWACRNIFFPAPVRRKESPVKSNRRGIFFKKR